MEQRKKKTGLIALLVLLALIIVFVAVYFLFIAKPVAGAKNITFEITHVDGRERIVELDTDAEFLRGALEEAELVEGVESTFGLWITGIDGYTADESRQEWWGYTRNGEYVETGVDTTPIYDGDVFQLTLNVGYDEF